MGFCVSCSYESRLDLKFPGGRGLENESRDFQEPSSNIALERSDCALEESISVKRECGKITAECT